MKLIMAVVNKPDSKRVTQELMKNGFQVTKLASTGGYLTRGNETLLIGVRQERLNIALDTIKAACHARSYPLTSVPYKNETEINMSNITEITVGGATVFVLNIEDFIKM